ncbi:hypothetical protein [Konateibacter massiliensis]|uniref:hypothetical protein n=1 Tax=Konateibacter massiliensis TaxID=2002841 RepID=UPI000C144BCE|nr:hypothetical protein [Konateibacter massiliensis]
MLTYKKVEKLVEQKNKEHDYSDIRYPLTLKRGVPDARYSNSYKYTLYNAANRGVDSVHKTLQDVVDSLKGE